MLARDYQAVLKRMRTGVPSRFDVAKHAIRLCGVVASVDSATGRAESIERLDMALE